MGEKIPEAWLTLEKRLIAYHEEKRVDILPFKQLETISATCGIFDRGELIQAVQFLHDLGAVQFFDTDFLRDMIVIYPQWIVDVMACLVTVHQGAVKDGKMLLKDISKVWEDYPSELHPWLLRLTEEFDLTCSLPDEEASIVPCLLPDGEPQYDWPHADPRKNIRESMTVYKFQYLPAVSFIEHR
ncbi:probable serine/threonine-protein kinase roco11 [Ruditapes philippinarum]|uniref:probable serine/threonine-protein kinase roco11 n=1 Tax=Ruditapes philippinarum TaxID=129788 RepID=UPI00295B5979|nr:probable serine/threonine-protein kinase roco11 [Ruditapes philippinarum]